MSVLGYIIGRKGGPPSDVIDKRPEANQAFIDRLPKSNDGYEFKKRGQDKWRKAAGKPDLKKKISGIPLGEGDAVWARRTASKTIFFLRAVDVVEPNEDYPYSFGTPGVKVLWNDVQTELNLLRARTDENYKFVSQGVCNCRRIDGSSSWSQHAWCNALDGHITLDGKFSSSGTTAVVNGVRDRGHAAEVLWQVSGHYSHFHFTAEPKKYGTPPCA